MKLDVKATVKFHLELSEDEAKDLVVYLDTDDMRDYIKGRLLDNDGHMETAAKVFTELKNQVIV